MVNWPTVVVGALGAVALAYINSFLKEQYVRHLDARAIAAGLAGELSSYEEAWPILRNMLETYLQLIDTQKRDQLTFRPFEKPRDAFYEGNVTKIGLLGSTLVNDVVFVYGHIGGFRAVFGLIQEHGTQMNDSELRARVTSAPRRRCQSTARTAAWSTAGASLCTGSASPS